MPKCCGPSCDCNIQAGIGVIIVGTGTLDDPFIVSATSIVATGETVVDPPEVNPTGFMKVVVDGEERFIPYY